MIYKASFNYIKGYNGDIVYAAIKDGIPFGLAAIEDKNKNIIVGILANDKSYTINGIGMIKFSNGVFYFGEIKNNIPIYKENYVYDLEKKRYTNDELKTLVQYKGFKNGLACLKDGSIVNCELNNGKPIGVGERYNFKKNINYSFDYIQFSETGTAIAYTPPKFKTINTIVNSNGIVQNKSINTSKKNSQGEVIKDNTETKKSLSTEYYLNELFIYEKAVKLSSKSTAEKKKLLDLISKLRLNLAQQSENVKLIEGTRKRLEGFFSGKEYQESKYCIYCNGSGLMKICKKCDGTGIIYCVVCSGRKVRSDGRVCLECKGIGFYSCYVCNGKKKNIKCLHKTVL